MALINPDTLNLRELVVRTNKVQKTHKGGRTMSWNVLVVVGDGEGHVGAGVGKARAIPDAIRKGVESAKRNLVKVPLVGSTIPHDVLCRVSAAQVLLRPAAPGTGVVAGGSVRALLEAAGIRDVLAKSLGSNNPINCAWATMEALRRLKRATDVARLRGKPISELVSKAVALAAVEAEEHDRALTGEPDPSLIAAISEPSTLTAEPLPDPPLKGEGAEPAMELEAVAEAPVAEAAPAVEEAPAAEAEPAAEAATETAEA